MVYIRPANIPLPTVWHRFAARGTKLRVQDVTNEQLEPAVQLLIKYFTADEPPCKYIEIQKHPAALAELEKLWRDTLKDQISVVCVEDKDDVTEIIGVNVLTVVAKSDKEEIFKTADKIWAKLFGAVDLVSRSVDIFTKFGVEQYLTAYGLVVDPKWRGCGIGKEILLARIPLCKAIGVKVTATVFTAAASQAVAKKAGFQDLYQISYEDLAKEGFRFPGVEQDTKYSKLMALEIY
ncbi:uncharacterized protein LOC125074938 [Vanessa atalanta]|uniref:uncharacterized protein LOC125074938 n=1 Tax=Vanessa atalanta TaxID=42275 RepID=UPI001FCDC4EB|nr:uncharacterized protein LOC125074938 [Vanessa atalanta]